MFKLDFCFTYILPNHKKYDRIKDNPLFVLIWGNYNVLAGLQIEIEQDSTLKKSLKVQHIHKEKKLARKSKTKVEKGIKSCQKITKKTNKLSISFKLNLKYSKTKEFDLIKKKKQP